MAACVRHGPACLAHVMELGLWAVRSVLSEPPKSHATCRAKVEGPLDNIPPILKKKLDNIPPEFYMLRSGTAYTYAPAAVSQGWVNPLYPIYNNVSTTALLGAALYSVAAKLIGSLLLGHLNADPLSHLHETSKREQV